MILLDETSFNANWLEILQNRLVMLPELLPC